MIRTWPSISTMTTVVRPASAQKEMMLTAQSTPFAENAVARVLWLPSPAQGARSLYDVMPTTTSDTATYSTVTIASEPMIPRGTAFCGFFVSSAVVATMSKPMNAKNTSEAPASRPKTPNELLAPPAISENSDWSTPVSPEPPVEPGGM